MLCCYTDDQEDLHHTTAFNKCRCRPLNAADCALWLLPTSSFGGSFRATSPKMGCRYQHMSKTDLVCKTAVQVHAAHKSQEQCICLPHEAKFGHMCRQPKQTGSSRFIPAVVTTACKGYHQQLAATAVQSGVVSYLHAGCDGLAMMIQRTAPSRSMMRTFQSGPVDFSDGFGMHDMLHFRWPWIFSSRRTRVWLKGMFPYSSGLPHRCTGSCMQQQSLGGVSVVRMRCSFSSKPCTKKCFRAVSLEVEQSEQTARELLEGSQNLQKVSFHPRAGLE